MKFYDLIIPSLIHCLIHGKMNWSKGIAHIIPSTRSSGAGKTSHTDHELTFEMGSRCPSRVFGNDFTMDNPSKSEQPIRINSNCSVDEFVETSDDNSSSDELPTYETSSLLAAASIRSADPQNIETSHHGTHSCKYSSSAKKVTIKSHRSVRLTNDNVVEHDEDSSCGRFCNRLILCLLSVSMLWASSLQICVAIVSTNISVPSFSSVVDNCQFAYDTMMEQRDQYKKCSKSAACQVRCAIG